MVDQIHKRLTDEQVKAILDRYIRKEIDAGYAMGLLDLKRRQFFSVMNSQIVQDQEDLSSGIFYQLLHELYQ